jgi:cytochrome oxidase Cu insertion factor (SCO1/SenC/PrrC family)
MSEAPKTVSKAKAIAVIGFMFALFLVPYTYILYVYKTSDMPTTGSTERGVFFKPFIDLKAHTFTTLDGQNWDIEHLEKKWVLANFADITCENSCLDRIFNTQQALSTLTEYKGQVVQVVFLHHQLQASADLITVLNLKKPKQSAIDNLEQSLFNALRAQIPDTNSLSEYIVIIDPDGQLLLYYSPEQSFQDILRDLKRLLKASAGKN